MPGPGHEIVSASRLRDESIQFQHIMLYCCIHNLTDGMPWIYPPIQTYGYVACLAACFYLTYRIAINWAKVRPPREASQRSRGRLADRQRRTDIIAATRSGRAKPVWCSQPTPKSVRM